MSSKKATIKDYISTKVKPVFDQLIARIVIEKPDDVYTWSITWLLQQQRGSQLLQVVNHNLSEEEEEEDEVVLEIKQHQKQQTRSAVSAEVYGEYNKKEDFKPRFIQKSDGQIERIKKRILNSFMFQALDDKDLHIVLGAMEEKRFQVGDFVIKQGDDGNELYVIDEGRLECYKRFVGLQEEKLLKTYIPGESFGELALLYNAPRAATIKAIENVTTFALDRETFNNIVKFSAIKKREQMEEILSKIELLQSMDNYERVQLCDVLREEKHQAGKTIITEGEIGDRIYLIIEGELEAYSDKLNEKVYDYKSGDYFGELYLPHIFKISNFLLLQPYQKIVQDKQPLLLKQMLSYFIVILIHSKGQWVHSNRFYKEIWRDMNIIFNNDQKFILICVPVFLFSKLKSNRKHNNN